MFAQNHLKQSLVGLLKLNKGEDGKVNYLLSLKFSLKMRVCAHIAIICLNRRVGIPFHPPCLAGRPHSLGNGLFGLSL